MPAARAPGVLFAVVGPSGAGKDSVIGFARHVLADDPRVMFVRRVISRPAHDASEDHEPVSVAEFERRAASGAFAVTWQAHGLHYGLPATSQHHVAAGGIAVANGSRQALDAVFETYPDVQVVEVVAAPEIIAGRLAARGRESGDEIVARLKRSVAAYRGAERAVTIDNSGALDAAGDAFVRLIRDRLACHPSALTKSG